MTNTSHRDRALDLLGASLTAHDQLEHLYAQTTPVDKRIVAELHEAVRIGIKTAQVEALLAIEDRLAQLVDLGPSA